jgi:2-polyprenyl-3-methyl-5-hydroxy-6-metoxy-1,4-benzoquinol methylase
MNNYDDFRPDIARLLGEQDMRMRPVDPTAGSADGLGWWESLASRARRYGLGALVKTRLHRRLVYANLKLGWFKEFQEYWVGELGNRPIHPHDFYFLMGVYRQKAQQMEIESTPEAGPTSDAQILRAWQDSAAVYYLFAHTYRLALSPLRVHPFVRFIPRRGRVAEYGCGAAPILTGLARLYRDLDVHLVGADIPHILFHYARWKFRNDPFVTMVPIAPDDDAPLTGTYDTIFCLEVLEHLPRPIPVLQHFWKVLKPKGHLVFDYVRSDGTGLDTRTSLEARIPALELIRDRFDIVQGAVPLDGYHVQPAVARKR